MPWGSRAPHAPELSTRWVLSYPGLHPRPLFLTKKSLSVLYLRGAIMEMLYTNDPVKRVEVYSSFLI